MKQIITVFTRIFNWVVYSLLVQKRSIPTYTSNSSTKDIITMIVLHLQTISFKGNTRIMISMRFSILQKKYGSAYYSLLSCALMPGAPPCYTAYFYRQLIKPGSFTRILLMRKIDI